MSIKGKSQSKVNFRAFSHRRHLDGVYGNEIVRSALFSANKKRAYTRKKHFEFFVNFFRFRTPQYFQQKIILLFYLFCLFSALSKRPRRPAARPRNGRFFPPDPPASGDDFSLFFASLQSVFSRLFLRLSVGLFSDFSDLLLSHFLPFFRYRSAPFSSPFSDGFTPSARRVQPNLRSIFLVFSP